MLKNLKKDLHLSLLDSYILQDVYIYLHNFQYQLASNTKSFEIPMDVQTKIILKQLIDSTVEEISGYTAVVSLGEINFGVCVTSSYGFLKLKYDCDLELKTVKFELDY